MGPYIFLKIFLSKVESWLILSVKILVLLPYIITGLINVLYALIFSFL